MAVAEEERTEQSGGSSAPKTALVAAAAAAATGAATLAVRKALSHDGDGGGAADDRSGERAEQKQGKSKGSGSMLSTAAASAWDSASDVVLPMAEDAVAAAGRYVAEHAPEVVRDRLVPRFIEAFNEAN
jgi:hypothetical protein